MKNHLLAVAALGLMLPASSLAQTLINGAGATFPYPIYSKWFDTYAKVDPSVRFNYQSIGSGGGQKQILAETVDFGASDGPMSDENLAKAPRKLLHIPTVAGADVVSYNVPGLTSLKLDGPTLADIFLGKITKWNDPKIAGQNAGVKLPAQDIIVVHRSDGSGTTYIFVDYLSHVSPEWKTKVGTNTSVSWPTGSWRQRQRRRGGPDQAGAGLDRLHRAGLRQAEPSALCRHQELGGKLHHAVDRVGNRGAGDRDDPGRLSFLDGRPAGSQGVSNRGHDLAARLPEAEGSPQGSEAGRVPEVGVRRGREDGVVSRLRAPARKRRPAGLAARQRNRVPDLSGRIVQPFRSGRRAPAARFFPSDRAMSASSTSEVVPGTVPLPMPSRWADRLFHGVSLLAATGVGALFLLVIYILTRGAHLSLAKFGWHFLVSSEWDPVQEDYGALPFIYGTVVSSVIALLIAVPLSIGTAVFLTDLSPRWMRQPLASLIEMLAAVPSVIWGLWGVFVMVPWLRDHAFPFLREYLGFLPLFQGPIYGVSMLAGGLIIAIMILPIVTSVSREILRSVPNLQREAAYGLGATRWEVTRIAVLSYARRGLLGAAVLGLGRALGETMAVTMVIGNRPEIVKSLFAPGYTLASVIANEFNEATTEMYVSALFELGLVLVGVTITVNILAQVLIKTIETPGSRRA